MIANKRHNKTVAIFGAVLVLMTPSTSPACLCDWLLCGPTSCIQQSTCSQPTPCMTLEPTCYPSGYGIGGYSPTYRSSWNRVPVTIYRPTVTTDPLSGVTATTLAACNTFEQQVRRTKRLSLQQRPIYWQSYNSPYQQQTPTVLPVDSSSESPSTVTPYYEPGNARLVPVPSGTPRASEPADQQPRLRPEDFRRPPQASAVPRGHLRPTEVRRVTPLRGMPAKQPEQGARTATVARGLRGGSTVSWQTAMPTEGTTRTVEAWDASGWKSARD